MIISEKIKELEGRIKFWNESGISATLAPWHCGLGHDMYKSPYQQTLDEIKYLKNLLKENYCEHKPDMELRRKAGCITDHEKCKKCGEFYR